MRQKDVGRLRRVLQATLAFPPFVVFWWGQFGNIDRTTGQIAPVEKVKNGNREEEGAIFCCLRGNR